MEYRLIGNRIKAARQEKRMTQEKFAEFLGVSVSFISQVESGGKKFNLERITEVCKILDKPISYFIDGSTESLDDPKIADIVELLSTMNLKKLRLIRDLVRVVAFSDEM